MNGEMEHRRRTQKQIQHHKKRKKKNRKKRIRIYLIRTLFFCILTFIFILIAALILHLVKPDKDEDATPLQQAAERIKIELNIVNPKKPRTPFERTGQVNTATEANHKINGLSICMYHYVYDKNDPPKNLNTNYIEVGTLEEELQYLVENDYYFPSWEEVRKYVDGEIHLPEKSVVLTFDDGSKNFLKLGLPLFEKYKVPVTSFLITSKDAEERIKEYGNDYVTFQSHSHDMHKAGGNIGHGGIFTALTVEDAVADLKESIRLCGNGQAFAYPYGDYTDSCIQAVEDAGFLCGVTTEYGRVYPGQNPLLLPRVRMIEGQSLSSFITAVE